MTDLLRYDNIYPNCLNSTRRVTLFEGTLVVTGLNTSHIFRTTRAPRDVQNGRIYEESSEREYIGEKFRHIINRANSATESEISHFLKMRPSRPLKTTAVASAEILWPWLRPKRK